MSNLLAKLMKNFEDGFGYPPGENRLCSASPERGRAAAEALPVAGIPSDLIKFYREIDSLSMPDVENGFFIHSYVDVVNGVEGDRPTLLSGPVDDRICVFGSDGGGGLFALGLTNGQVYRLSGGALIGSTYEVDESGVEVVESNLSGFLHCLHIKLSNFIPPAWN